MSARVGRWARRATFLVHRWLGIVLALLMAIWAVSGIVMMYVAFPETTEAERLSGLQPLDFTACCAAEADGQPLRSFPELSAARIEMLGGAPVLHWQGGDTGGRLRLTDGTTPPMTLEDAESIAVDHMRRANGTTPPVEVAQVERDQWTVYGRFRQHAPLYKASFADDAGTALYISGRDGLVVQDTNAHERFWNWLGAVPHWLYFTAFREIQPLWYNFVVYASLLGTFLTVTGIYIGVRQYGRGKKRIPYKGMAYWHHVTGLVFGIFTLLWVFSGLLSMNPWGWLEGKGAQSEVQALAGRQMDSADLTAMVSALQSSSSAGAVQAELAIQDNTAFAILSDSKGKRTRVALPTLEPRPLDEQALIARSAAAMPGTPILSQGMIHAPDAYYYGHKTDVNLPVWRATYDDGEETRLYFDPSSGELLRKADATARAYRWLHYGLHRWDFGASIRARPVWDVVVVPLMVGVSFLCIIGFWVGMKRLFRKRAKPAQNV